MLIAKQEKGEALDSQQLLKIETLDVVMADMHRFLSRSHDDAVSQTSDQNTDIQDVKDENSGAKKKKRILR